MFALEEIEHLTRRKLCTGAAASGLVALVLPSCVGNVETPWHPPAPSPLGSPPAAPTPSAPAGPPAGSGAPDPAGGQAGAGGGSEPAPTGPAGSSGSPGGGAVADASTGPREPVLPPAPPTAPRAPDAGRPPAVSPPPPDAGGAPVAACAGSFNTNMRATAFGMNTATFFSARRTFVCRDDQGLYAMTAVCTHAGCSVRFNNADSGFRCPCHGSGFDFDGSVNRGPANSPLRHFEVCVDGEGNVSFDSNRVVNRGDRFRG